MGLKSETLADLAEAFNNDLSDAVKQATLITFDKAESIYDPIVGESFINSTSTSIRGILTDFILTDQLNSTIVLRDCDFVVLKHEIPVEIELKDNITIGSDTYTVIKITTDPLDLTLTLYLNFV